MSTSSLTPVTNSNYIAGGSYSSRDLSQIIPKIEYVYATFKSTSGFNPDPLTQTITISGNGTTNYSVVISQYYNYVTPGGSTYNVSAQSDNFGTIVIYNKQNTSFTFTVNRGNGDFTNLDLVFAVIYGIS